MTESERMVSIVSEQFRVPDQSVNRSKYSQPRDVLYPDNHDKSVAWFPASALPAVIPVVNQKKTVEWAARVVHVPLRHNYAHAEVGIFNGDARLEHKKKASRTVCDAVCEAVAAELKRI